MVIAIQQREIRINMQSIDFRESQATGLGTCVGGNGHLWDLNYKVNASA